MQSSTKKSSNRWSIGGYYLDQPYPTRGGYWYACRYNPRTGNVDRRSLDTTDQDEAKHKLAASVMLAPAKIEDAPHPKDVLTVSILESYLNGHGSNIRTADQASRTVEYVVEWLEETKNTTASVGFWTPSQQKEFARWLHARKGHNASTIERNFNVISAAFNAATNVELRSDLLGHQVEVIAQVAWGAAPGRLRRYDSGDGAGVAAVNMSQPMDDSAA